MITKPSSSKKGYSLLETVIALALISIVFGVAMTSVVTSFRIRMRVANTKFFIAETSNYLECYKMRGSNYFYDNAEYYLDCGKYMTVLNTSEHQTEYILYYSGDYKLLLPDQADKASFVMHIKINYSFSAYVTEYSTGKNVFYLKKPFVSHYDL